MQISPEGWAGNYFNSWNRKANQLEVLPAYQLSAKSWHGSHEVRFGTDILYRNYDGTSTSHPIELLAQDGFGCGTDRLQGTGLLSASDAGGRGIYPGSLDSERPLDAQLRSTFDRSNPSVAMPPFAPRIGAAYSLN